MDSELGRILTGAGYFALGAVGGLLGFTLRSYDAGGPYQWRRALVEGLGSGFVGYLVMLACVEMGLSAAWTGFAVGIFGWLGASVSIGLLQRIAYSKLGVAPPRSGGSDEASH